MKKAGHSILVVDDQKDIVDTISTILEKQGHSIYKAYCGKDCLSVLEKDEVKLVFLDIMMPGMSGYEVAEKLRDIYDSRMKIVFVSIKPKSEVDLENVDGFIQKPFEIQDILDAVNRFM